MLIFITLCLQISHLSGIVWLPLPLVWDWWSSPWLVGVQVSHVCVNTSLMSLSGIFRAVTVLFLVTSYTEVCVLSLHHFLPEHEFTLINPLFKFLFLLTSRQGHRDRRSSSSAFSWTSLELLFFVTRAAGIPFSARNSLIICPRLEVDKPYLVASADQLTLWSSFHSFASAKRASLSTIRLSACQLCFFSVACRFHLVLWHISVCLLDQLLLSYFHQLILFCSTKAWPFISSSMLFFTSFTNWCFSFCCVALVVGWASFDLGVSTSTCIVREKWELVTTVNSHKTFLPNLFALDRSLCVNV